MAKDVTKLPEYPVGYDLWDRLVNETRPIVVYGMGNGADKLFDRLISLGVSVSDIFASDGFVRGHSFRGMRVKSFSEIRSTYSDFVILLSFASNRAEVVDMIADIDKEYTLYIPDMPVAGVDEYFDKDFYNSNFEKIKAAYDALADVDSRNVFASVVWYKLAGEMRYLESAWCDTDELYSIMPKEEIRTVIDVGAYNGDTLREMKRYLPHLSHAIALEPDKRTFKRLMKYAESESDLSIDAYNAAAWNENAEGELFSSGNRNSTAVATASYEHKTDGVSLLCIDSLALSPDYIKYDVEGAEMLALEGSRETITRHAPTLLVSLYHRSRDIFELVLYMKEKHPDYNLYLKRLRCLPAWELDLIALA